MPKEPVPTNEPFSVRTSLDDFWVPLLVHVYYLKYRLFEKKLMNESGVMRLELVGRKRLGLEMCTCLITSKHSSTPPTMKEFGEHLRIQRKFLAHSSIFRRFYRLDIFKIFRCKCSCWIRGHGIDYCPL